jgi:uncharacterized protein YggE
MKTISIAALAALLAAATAVAVIRPGTAHGSASPSDRTITVTGTATARGAPDTAVFTFGVDTDGATAKTTLAANSAQMRRVIVALVHTGITRADIQTQNVSVYPRHSESGALEGYSVSGSVTATVRRLVRASAAVDAAVAAGANETSGPQFDRSSGAELTQRALREAFADARTRAETLAKEAGSSLGEVRRIEQAAEPQPLPMGVYAEALSARTPIEPGTQRVQATVTVTFSLA